MAEEFEETRAPASMHDTLGAFKNLTLTDNDVGRSVVGALKAVLGGRYAKSPPQKTQEVEPASVVSALCTGEDTRGLLTVSPYVPSSLKSCSWEMADFRIVCQLYNSSVSVVYQAQHKASGMIVVLKMYRKKHMVYQQRVQAAREACLHPKIRHPNIISLYASWIEDNKIIMCIEHAPTGSAFRKLRSKGAFDEMVTARYIIQCLLHALQFMHGFGLVHRDIKPENILLTSDGCCLADFGLSINQKVEKPSLCLGTFDYMAPELFRLTDNTNTAKFRRPSDPGMDYYNEKVDVWAIGVLCYELMVGKAPFAGKTTALTIQNIMNGADLQLNNLRQAEIISDLGLDFMAQCLQWYPQDRPCVKALLKHPWIKTHCSNTAEIAHLAHSMAQESITSSHSNRTTLQAVGSFTSKNGNLASKNGSLTSKNGSVTPKHGSFTSKHASHVMLKAQ